MSGKDWLNSWVNNFKENWVEKLVRKWVEKMQWKNVVQKTWLTNCVIKIGGKIVLKNFVKKLCEKISWKIV